MTDGRFQIAVFAAGEIVPGLQVLDAVQNNTVEIGNSASYYYFGKDPAFTFGTALPFGLNSRQQFAWFHHGGGNELMNELFATYNCIGFPSGNTNAQMGGWFRKQVNTSEDLKGLKFRVGGFAGKILNRIGVVPQQIAAGDIYPALERGTIDAAEWVGPYDDEKLGFSKVAKYYYYPGWWEGGATGHYFINLEAWNKLPKAYQSVLQAAAGEGTIWQMSKYDYVNPPAMRRLIKSGVEVKPFSQEILDACFKAANETYAEISATNPRFKKMYDSLTAFRDDAYLWWQIAELPFDVFQIRNRGKS
jgi:TRAP-type mannitol/chloroaromatic compound transport system substrate-binding protein